MNRSLSIVGLGEVLWDVFPDGAKFGGAPANFACSAAGIAAGRARVFIASGVGDDELGRLAKQSLSNRGVDLSCLQQATSPTGTVDIQIDDDGNASYTFADDTAWDRVQWTDSWSRLAKETDAVCFGTLGQRSAAAQKAIEQFLRATSSDALRILDINLRWPFVNDRVIAQSLELANVLKLNEDELPYVANLYGLDGSPQQQLHALARQFELNCVALTRGSDGSMLVRGDETSEMAAGKTDIVDTVGAGDAFTAALTLGLLGGESLPTINRHASRIAAYVCSQPGATPPIPAELTKSDGLD